jgi:PAS domain S-box-containing protein
MVKMFGYDHPEEIIGRTHNLLVHPDDVEQIKDYNRRRQAGETVPDRYEFKGRKKNGEAIYVEVSAAKTVYQGGPVTLAFLRNVTERKQAEMKIQTSLQEKEILLKEIHHRVKNNLAVIASILSLQSANAPDKTYQDIFQECVNRIKTMSKIHTQLYQAKDLAHINFKSYLQELIPELFRSYQVRADEVTLNLQIEDFTPDINTAIPLGLIVNELFTNAIKYAFSGGRKGEIRVSLKKHNSQIVLTVADNGIGFPADLDLTRAQSLGLQLVTALVYQLRGTVEIKREQGTEFVITFPAEK